MNTFLVGEIATGQNFADFTEHNGQDLEVIEVLGMTPVIDMFSLESSVESGYLVRCPIGDRFFVKPCQLKKKQRGLEPDLLAWIEVFDVIDRVRNPAWAAA